MADARAGQIDRDAEVATAAGGLLFLVPLLAQLGLPAALAGGSARVDLPQRIFATLLRRFGSSAAIFAAMFCANFSTYCVTSLQLALAHPDPVSGFWGAAAKFLAVFAITQIPLAVAEGFVGVLLFRFLAGVVRPELERRGIIDPIAASETNAEETTSV